MDLAEGGKIETVLYSAACGSLNSSANAGNEAPIRIDPTNDTAQPQNVRVLLRMPDRFRLPVSPIGRRARKSKKSRENYRSGFAMPRPAA
jgi:hypothetical protein